MKTSQKSLMTVMGTAIAFMFLILVVVRATANNYVQENTTVEGEAIDFSSLTLTDFNRIELAGSGDVVIKQGSDWNVDIQIVDGRKDQIKVTNNGGVLAIGPKTAASFFGGMDMEYKAEVTMPELKAVQASGAMNVDLFDLSSDTLDIEASGAVDIEAFGGRIEQLNLEASGAADIDLREMPTVSASVEAAGAVNVRLHMDGGELNAELAGAGAIIYRGHVSEKRTRLAGVGFVGAEEDED